MKLNNEFTAPDHRFFLPLNNEVEHHESFDITGVPQVQLLAGDWTFVISAEDTVTPRMGYSAKDFPRNLSSGLQVERLASPDESLEINKHVGGYHFIDPEQMEMLDNPIAEYVPGENDTLILAVDWGCTQLPQRKIREHLYETGALHDLDARMLLLEANRELPYADPDNEVSLYFGLQGIITPDQKMLTWKSGRYGGSRYIIDLCVVNANLQNNLELALLVDELETGGPSSLLGMLSVQDAAKAYLEYCDKKNETNYVPTGEPRNRPEVSDFSWSLTDEERDIFRRVVVAAHESWDEKR